MHRRTASRRHSISARRRERHRCPAPRSPRLPGPVYPAEVRVSPTARLSLFGIYGLIVLAIPILAFAIWRRLSPAPILVPTGRPALATAGAGTLALAGAAVGDATS